MCGIAGFLNIRDAMTEEASTRLYARMIAALTHRGPDAAGHVFAALCRLTPVVGATPALLVGCETR